MNHQDTKITRNGPGEEVDRRARQVIGAAIEVHQVLGPGFLEKIYEEALCEEFRVRGIPFQRQVSFSVNYKGKNIGEGRVDVLVGGCLIVEIKAVEALTSVHLAQALSYLKTTGHRLALLINFNAQVLKDGIRRVVL